MRQYVVDAFTDQVFAGNPAAICILEEWPPDALMMSIAAENNLSETAFAVKGGSGYHLRWFTLSGEIDLCGHATLACAYVVLNHYETGRDTVTFETLSGDLTVVRRGSLYEMDFPAFALRPVPVTDQMAEAIGVRPQAAYMGRDLLCVYDNASVIEGISPDLDRVRALDGLLLHVTAPGGGADCVSRTFAPKCDVSEDPVCGSGHCHIAPFWAGQLGKARIVARQASKRGGVLYCRMEGDRVKLSGEAALFSIDELFV